MRMKNFILSVAIMIVTLSVVIYGINTFYERPKYSDFCGEFKTQEIIETQQRCEEIGGQWNPYPTEYPKKIDGELGGWCDRDYTCRQEYDNAKEIWSRNIFLFAIPLGIAIIALGSLVFGLEVVGAGLMGGGVGTILYGIGGYWRYTEDWLKFLISLIGLIALIWLSYRANKKFGKK